MGHALLVSPEGLLEVLHSELDIDVRSYLEARGEGTYVALNIEVDGEPGGQVHFLADPTGEMNPRARDVLASLTGVHVILTGSVAFTGLSPERTVELVRDVG